MKLIKLAALTLALGTGASASAALLNNAVAIQPWTATATSNYPYGYLASETIDMSDLSSTYASGLTSTAQIDTITNLNNARGWHGEYGESTGNITFNLGGTYTLDRVYLYWMNAGNNNNIANFSIQVSGDEAFSAPITAASFGFPSAPQNRVDFAALATGQFVRLNWTSLQGSYPGLNEFIAGGVAGSLGNSAEVPEPGSIALMALAGLGLLAARRRK
jgi:hypothetical protein